MCNILCIACLSCLYNIHKSQVSVFVVPIRGLVKVSSCHPSGPRDTGGCHPKGQRGAMAIPKKKAKNTDFDENLVMKIATLA